MARLRAGFHDGTITDDPLTSGATTINSANFAALPEVSGGDILVLVLDPLKEHGAPEIVHVTAHTASSSEVTVTRAAESTTAREHPVGTVWRHGPTTEDFLRFDDSSATDGDVLTWDDGASAWVPAADVGFTLIARHDVEETTTSTSAVDLITIPLPSVPVTKGLLVIYNFRKTSGAASAAGFGLTVNSTVVREATTTAASSIGNLSNVDEAQTGMGRLLIGPHSPDYRFPFLAEFQLIRIGNESSLQVRVATTAFSALIPDAAITSLTFRAISGSASQTIAMKDILIYEVG